MEDTCKLIKSFFSKPIHKTPTVIENVHGDDYILEINTKSWAYEISWVITDDNNKKLYEGPDRNSTKYSDYSTYKIPLSLEKKKYKLVMLDSYGDGWNGGSFKLLDNSDNIIKSGQCPYGYYAVSNIDLDVIDEPVYNKLALVIGVNYFNEQGELRGCCNDAHDLSKILSPNGYKVTLMTDEETTADDLKPTRNNIIRKLYEILHEAENKNITHVWVSFSGHGYHIDDHNNDEIDGKDEVIITTDSYIRDDELNYLLVEPLMKLNISTVCLVDSCHSGTMIDLNYKYSNTSVEQATKNLVTCDEKGKFLLISGCMDTQTSADAYLNGTNEEDINLWKFRGACTWAFIKAYQESYPCTFVELLDKINRNLKSRGFSQHSVGSVMKKDTFYLDFDI